MKKVTWAEIADFEKDLLFKLIDNPNYRYGQAFLNYFPWVHASLDEDGDLGASRSLHIWQCNKRKEVLDMLDWYLEDRDTES